MEVIRNNPVHILVSIDISRGQIPDGQGDMTLGWVVDAKLKDENDNDYYAVQKVSVKYSEALMAVMGLMIHMEGVE